MELCTRDLASFARYKHKRQMLDDVLPKLIVLVFLLLYRTCTVIVISLRCNFAYIGTVDIVWPDLDRTCVSRTSTVHLPYVVDSSLFR